MHELSVCLSLLETIEQLVRRHEASSVAAIELQIGPLAGIEPDLLRNAWPLAAHGTIAEEAKLVIDTAEIVVRCTECGCESPASPNRLLCASCGDFRTRLVRGDEMILRRVEFGRRRRPAKYEDHAVAAVNSNGG